jgi:hypothetical protein
MTSYDDILGISRYMRVYDSHMSVYDEDSAAVIEVSYWSWILTRMLSVQELLYLIQACSSCPVLFPDSDAFVTGICRSACSSCSAWFPGQSRLHPAGPPECGIFVAPERHARSSTNDFILSIIFNQKRPAQRPGST